MAILSLARINRLALVVWTVGLVVLAVRWPAVGMLDATVRPRVRYGALAALWLSGLLTVLLWQRTLWVTMGSGAGFRPEGGSTPLFSLGTMQATVRERTLLAEAVRPGRWPFARLRVTAPYDAPDPAAAFELRITSAGDPDGRVLFEAPDADRRYVLADGSGDLEAVLTTDFRAELVEVDTPGTLRVADSHVTYDVGRLPFDAACLRTCAETAARLAEQVERASGERRGT